MYADEIESKNMDENVESTGLSYINVFTYKESVIYNSRKLLKSLPEGLLKTDIYLI